MSQHSGESDAWVARQMRTTMGLAAWTGAWVASLALAAFGPEAFWDGQVAPTVAAIVANVLIGVGMLLAHKRFLQSLDELQRSIQLQAMAWSLGAGLVGGMAWTLLDQFDLVSIEATIAQLVIFMGLVYLAACMVGALRYR
jgi:hypothetical protein